MDELVSKVSTIAAKAIDEAIKGMLERNGFVVGDPNNNMHLLLLQDDLRRENCFLQFRDNRYELWRNGRLADHIQPKLELVQQPEIARYSVKISF